MLAKLDGKGDRVDVEGEFVTKVEVYACPEGKKVWQLKLTLLLAANFGKRRLCALVS